MYFLYLLSFLAPLPSRSLSDEPGPQPPLQHIMKLQSQLEFSQKFNLRLGGHGLIQRRMSVKPASERREVCGER